MKQAVRPFLPGYARLVDHNTGVRPIKEFEGITFHFGCQADYKFQKILHGSLEEEEICIGCDRKQSKDDIKIELPGNPRNSEPEVIKK